MHVGRALPLQQPRALSHGMPRCTKDAVEEALSARQRDLLTTLDMVFFDSTSIYFEGQGGAAMGQYGFSKDHRPDLPQLVVGWVLDDSGTLLCSQILPGNSTDVQSLLPVRSRLERQFAVEWGCMGLTLLQQNHTLPSTLAERTRSHGETRHFFI